MPSEQPSKNHRIWILAGEPSGDRYGAELAEALLRREPSLCVRGMGAGHMRDVGVELLVDASYLAVVGLVETLRHLPCFLNAFRGLVRQAKQERPDAVVLIDNPGFNLRLAKKLHKLGIPVIYYVCPQVWAWGKHRIPKMARTIDRLLTIFPFEPDIFADTNLDARFVGHPLVDILAEYQDSKPKQDPSIVLLLPGSRASEIESLLPDFLGAADLLHARHPSLRFITCVPPGHSAELAINIAARHRAEAETPAPVDVEPGKALHWMQRATAGLAASGTVTLEAAILGLPLVTSYRLNPITYQWVKRLVKLPYFTIVNLVAEQPVFAEYLQNDVQPQKLADGLEQILPDGSRRAAALAGMAETVKRLGPSRDVANEVANSVFELAERPGASKS